MKLIQQWVAGKRASYSLILLSLVLIFAISLSGCGSSGGGSDSGTLPDQEVKYQGKTTAAPLNAENSNIFFAEIMGTGSGTTALAKFSPNQRKVMASRGHSLIPRIAGTFQDVLINQSRSFLIPRAKRLDRSVEETTPCESGSTSVKGEVADDGTGTFRITFEDCLKEGETLNGTAVIDVRKVDPATEEFTDFVITFDVLEFKDATSHYSTGGSYHILVFLDVGYERIDAELTVVDHLIKKTWKLENWTEILTYDNMLQPTIYTENFSGRLYDSEEGFVDVSLELCLPCGALSTSLYYSDMSRNFPDYGDPILLRGALGTRARLTILSGSGNVLVEVDTDGDSFYEPGDVYKWNGLLSSPPGNLPPMVGGVVITPESPRTSDILYANLVGGVLDIDGDSIITTYAWYKNGDLLIDQTGDSISQDIFIKGDVIFVRATIFDGTDSITVESETVTILGMLPVLEISPPSSAQYGEVVQFEARADDPDGDTVTYSLLFGPSGMVVDAATGIISWTPREPMFDDAIDVQFGVSAMADGEGVTATGTITVTDQDHGLPLARSGIKIPRRADGIRIADFDGDGLPEILMTDQKNLLYTMAWNGSEYVQDWVYPFDLTEGGSITAIEAYDVTGDGRPDIIVGVRKKIVVLDGVSRRIVQEISDDYGYHYAIRVGDIDADMKLEMVYLGTNIDLWSDKFTINVYDMDRLSFDWQSPETNFGLSLAIGNVDQDSAMEIVTSEGYVYDGLTYANEWTYEPGFGFVVDTGDLNNDGVDEIVGAEDGRGAIIYGAVSKLPLMEVIPDWEDLDALQVANIDGDPQAEIILGNGQWGDVMAYDGFSGGLEWKISSQEHGVSDIATGDTDGDSELEVVWASGASSSGADALVVAGFHPDIAVEWSNEAINGLGEMVPFQLDGPFVGGRWLQTESGNYEAVFASVSTNSGNNGTRIVRIAPGTGRMLWGAEVGDNWQRMTLLDGFDYDDDGTDEVFLTTRRDLYEGYFMAYDAAMDSTEWTSDGGGRAGVALTHGDMNDDGNSDLVAITGDGYVYIYDPFNAILLWKSTQLPGYGVDVEVVDLDGDDVLEIAVLTDQVLVVYEKYGDGYLQRSLKLISYGVALAIANLDGEKGSEIVIAAKSFLFSITGSIYLFKGKELEEKYHYPVAGLITDLGMTPENVLLLAVMTTSEYYPYLHNSRILGIDPFTGIEIWRSPDLIGVIEPDSFSFADTDGDGDLEMIIGTSSAMYVTR